ncbi:uncharacterized protein LOC114526201 isoform X2 [Dendronephthya gigantea]|uniref:uncharacterized protein LOC114526201 isoform X2 n=1 Tax=Dendronephthya gigantea TaxID=151771 RepID=UPI00106B67F3|nr:uncharacterized protein LOC114526201 isoform X2 [Dendronephthya gigantea]
MTTDGGGYILFGYINGTVTWGVPSNNETVQPFGDPHWSSEFGDVSVLDFRIQVASDDDMEKTKAHWAFRFKNKRVLKNLMIVDQGGCPNNFPGVGDVSYVKDLMTGEIVSKDFSCSIFGPYSFPSAKVGWTMMNLCLEQPCPYGFAYHWLFPVQVHFSGGFSYVSKANSSSSGSTAFFGCDKGKCCACYGPRGGRDVYCLEECEATNGGTITKHASAWFWVRLNPPRKVWEKCMEYRSEDESGDSAWYKLEGDRNIPVKERCGRSEPLINDGVVVAENLQDIPAVTGLLAFQKDSQTLNFRSNETWKTLAEEEKMMHTVSEQLRDFQTTVKERVDKLESTTAKKTETLKITEETVKNSRDLEMFTPNWKQCTWKVGDDRDYGLLRTCTFVVFSTREIFAFTVVIIVASDGISRLGALNVMLLLKVFILYGKGRTMKAFTAIDILKVIVAVFAKALSVLGSMLAIAMDLETLTRIPAGILSRVL